MDESAAVREVSKRFEPHVRVPVPSPEQLARSRARQEAQRQEMVRELEERRREQVELPPESVDEKEF